MADYTKAKEQLERALLAKTEARHKAAALPYSEKIRRMLQLAANLRALRTANPYRSMSRDLHARDVWVSLSNSISTQPNAALVVEAQSNSSAFPALNTHQNEMVVISGSPFTSRVLLRSLPPVGSTSPRVAIGGIDNQLEFSLRHPTGDEHSKNRPA